MRCLSKGSSGRRLPGWRVLAAVGHRDDHYFVIGRLVTIHKKVGRTAQPTDPMPVILEGVHFWHRGDALQSDRHRVLKTAGPPPDRTPRPSPRNTHLGATPS